LLGALPARRRSLHDLCLARRHDAAVAAPDLVEHRKMRLNQKRHQQPDDASSSKREVRALRSVDCRTNIV
jgi:hypothetical protein